MHTRRVKVWDLPTRIFHWLLVALIVAAVTTAKIGGSAMDWHGRIGLAILGLFTFRIVWGIIGSRHARFAAFVPTPSSVSAYLRGQWTGVGHNPLGAISVFALLALIGLQLGTGLFGNDDIAFDGPLSKLITKELSDRLTGIHKFSINVLIALIALHIAAVAFYSLVKKNNLVRPMITGWKDLRPGENDTTESAGGGARAAIIAVLVALATVYGGSGSWI